MPHMPAVPQQETKTSPHKLRVLVVDDSHVLAETLGWMIELMGHDIQLAHNGADALSAGRSFRPDVVLLDIGLSGMNGYEVCQKMRADPAFKQCTIIAQTGWNTPEHLQRAKEAGFDHHLVKPIPIDVLAQLLPSLPVLGPEAV